MKRLLSAVSISLVLSCLLGVLPLTAEVASATAPASQSKNDVCAGIGTVDGSGNCDSTAGTQVSNVVAAAVNLLSVIVGLLAVIMIIVAGARFITSGGDTSKVAGAKNAVIYALIGLVVVALAQVIVRFVLTQSTKA